MSRPPAPILVRAHEATEVHYHEWVHVGEHETRDRLGRENNNGSTRWLVVSCNNTGCAARALVSEEVVVDVVTAAFGRHVRDPIGTRG